VIQPLKEFVVDTECGRHFIWSAFDLESLLRDLIYRGYRATFVMELSEYEAEVAKKEAQEELHHEHREAIEKARMVG